MKRKITTIGILFMMVFSGMTVMTLAGEVQTQGEETTFEYQFKKGWNLITLPLEVENNSANFLFDGLIKSGVMLKFFYGWNATNQVYVVVEELEPGYGYWVYLYENISYNITGDVIVSDLAIDLGVPDNMIGWINDNDITAEHICQSISGCESVSISSGQINDLGNVEYITHYTGNPDNNFKIVQGVGFWVRVSISSVWNGYAISNLHPIADAGGPCKGLIGEKILLNGSQSFDFDGEIVSYSWSYTTRGESSPSEFMGDGKIIEFSWDDIGTYNVTLKVTDDRGAEGYDNTTVIITENINKIAILIGIIDNLQEDEHNISFKMVFVINIDLQSNQGSKIEIIKDQEVLYNKAYTTVYGILKPPLIFALSTYNGPPNTT